MKGSLADRQGKLHTALQEEDKRDKVNSSKFRAVEQRMDYEGFRQMVLGANLKPTKAGDLHRIADAQRDRFNPVERSQAAFARVEDHSFRGKWTHAQDVNAKLIVFEEAATEELDRVVDFDVYASIIKTAVDAAASECADRVKGVLLKLMQLRDLKSLNKFLSRAEKASLKDLLRQIDMEYCSEAFSIS